MEVSQMYRQTSVKTVCTDVAFLAMLDLLEIELSSRAHEDEEDKRRQKSANVGIAASAAAGKGSGKGKSTTKPTCKDYLTDNGCTRGGQCSFLHPPTVGRCLSCGTKHAVADCKRPRQEKTALQHHPRHHHQRPTTTTTKVEAKVTLEQRLRINQSQKVRQHQSQRQKLDT